MLNHCCWFPGRAQPREMSNLHFRAGQQLGRPSGEQEVFGAWRNVTNTQLSFVRFIIGYLMLLTFSFQCGHCYCVDCIQILIKEYSQGKSTKCAVCRWDWISSKELGMPRCWRPSLCQVQDLPCGDLLCEHRAAGGGWIPPRGSSWQPFNKGIDNDCWDYSKVNGSHSTKVLMMLAGIILFESMGVIRQRCSRQWLLVRLFYGSQWHHLD